MNADARRKHIAGGGRALLPVSRMRHIRWEEAVLRSRSRRDGIEDPIIRHTDCHCGSIECLGQPFDVSNQMRAAS